jgi:general secretion pathway protein D
MSQHRPFLALALLVALVAACAGPRSRVATPPPRTARPPAATPAFPTGSPAPAPGPKPTVPPGQPPATAQAPPSETAPAPAPPIPLAPAPAGRGRQIVLNFDNADIEAVIQAASEIAGFSYTLGPGVAGKKVTVQTAGRIPEDEVFNVLLAVLEVNGVTAIRTGNLYKIVPLAAARERPLATIIGAQPDPTRPTDEVITQIIPIVHGAAERIAAVIRPFVQGGNLVVHGNLLLVTDTAGNVGRLLQIVGALDVETVLDELRIIPVRYADAVEVAKTLNDFFGGRRVRAPTPTPAPTPAAPRAPGAPPAPPGAPPGAEPGERPPLILSDKRTNALIVSARRADLDLITRLIEQLDVDTQANKRVFVYYVENVKAKELAATLTEIFGRPGEAAARPERREPGQEAPRPPRPTTPFAPPPTPPPAPGAAPTAAETEAGVAEGEVKVIADEPNNALIITTFPRNWPLIEDTIRKLDRTPKQVLIEVLVVEITLEENFELGIEWALRGQRDVTIGGTTYNIGTVTRLNPETAAAATAGLTFLIFETDRFLGALNLLATDSRLRVLSSPHILTSENKKAVINVSTSIPIPTQQQAAQVGVVDQQPIQPTQSTVLTQNIEYIDAGIVLTVTPRISDKRVVALDVKQTVNDVGAPLPPTNNPTIIKREAETSVVLYDNQTLVLGGLIQTNRSTARTGIPWLMRIPVLGVLFGSSTDMSRRTELLILITPRVIGDPSEGRELVEQIREQRKELQRELRGHPSILRPELTPPSEPPEPPPPAPAPAVTPGGFLPGGSPTDR